MKKTFCDVCEGMVGSESERVPDLERPWGDKYLEDAETVRQPIIRLSARFSFAFRPDNFQGQPDLCLKCQILMMLELADKLTRLMGKKVEKGE